MVFIQRQRMSNLLLWAFVVVRTSQMKISRRHSADCAKKSHQKACRTCSTIIFHHPTNQIIDLWRIRCRCCRHFLNSPPPKLMAHWLHWWKASALTIAPSHLFQFPFFYFPLQSSHDACVGSQRWKRDLGNIGHSGMMWNRCNRL